MGITTIQVASIFPIPQFLWKPRVYPQTTWKTAAWIRDTPPSTCNFRDQYEDVFTGRDVDQGIMSSGRPIYEARIVTGEHLANDFVTQNTFRPPRNCGQPGIWIVDSLGQGTTCSIISATNTHPVVLQLDRPHRIDGAIEVTIGGGQGTWGAINSTWQATPVTETQISIPVDATPFGQFISSNVNCNYRVHLSLEEETKIMMARQDSWMDYWVKDARKWAVKDMNRIIFQHHMAGAWFNLSGETWQVKHITGEFKACPFCLKRIPHAAVICEGCGKVADPEGYVRVQAEMQRRQEAASRAVKSERTAEIAEMARARGLADHAAQQSQSEEPVDLQTLGT